MARSSFSISSLMLLLVSARGGRAPAAVRLSRRSRGGAGRGREHGRSHRRPENPGNFNICTAKASKYSRSTPRRLDKWHQYM